MTPATLLLRRWLPRLVPLALPAVVWWAARQQRRLLALGVPLDASQWRIAAAVGVAAPGRVRLCRLDRMPFPAARALAVLARIAGLPGPDVDGLTLGHAICVRGGALDDSLLAHECRHVQQVERAGSLRTFLAAYLRQVARHGYRDAPYEVDARAAAAAVCGKSSRRAVPPATR